MKTWTLVVETISPACRVAILPSSTPWILKVVSPTVREIHAPDVWTGTVPYPVRASHLSNHISAILDVLPIIRTIQTSRARVENFPWAEMGVVGRIMK